MFEGEELVVEEGFYYGSEEDYIAKDQKQNYGNQNYGKEWDYYYIG